MSDLLKIMHFDDVLGYFAAGTTKRTSSIVDTANCDGVVFVCHLGTLLDTGTLDCYVEQNTLNQTSGMARLAGQAVFTVTAVEAAYTNSNIIIDVYRPAERYLQCNITPAVANAVIRGITAIKYYNRVAPVTRTTGTLLATSLASPAEV